MTSAEHARQREAVKALLSAQGFTWAATAVFNRDTTPASSKRALSALHARMDRAFLGRNWQRAPADRRSFAVWFPEHVRTNLHWHGLIRVPAEHAERFLAVGPKAWKRIIVSGNLDVRPITDLTGWSRYVTKEGVSNYLISTEFHS